MIKMIGKKREKADMENNNNNPTAASGQGNNFFSGFLLGTLVGALVVFLLGTKKGKRIWKAISEEGLDNISNILDEANNSQDSQDEALEPSSAKATEGQGQFIVKERSIVGKPKVRRFFRGISRHVN